MITKLYQKSILFLYKIKIYYFDLLLRYPSEFSKAIYNFFKNPSLKISRERRDFNFFLKQLGPQNKKKIFNNNESVLVDGMWDNACQWFRYSLVRKALRLDEYQEIGLIGKWNKKKSISTFEEINITVFKYFNPDRIDKDVFYEAFKLIKNFKNPEDIISHVWPNKVPGGLIYDHLLLTQRKPVVDLNDDDFCYQIAFILNSFRQSKKLLKSKKFKIIFLSHIFPAHYLALISTALILKINVVIIYSSFGTLRLLRMKSIDDYKLYTQPPDLQNWMDKIDSSNNNFFNIGKKYLTKRINGKGLDLGSQLTYSYAKKLNKDLIQEKYEWYENKPIIGIYCPQWFDTPHAYGMSNFRDIYDWFNLTLNEIKKNNFAYWLIKPHPVEKWYGGFTLADNFKNKETNNIKIFSEKVNNLDFINLIDAAITVHGTIALELTNLGKTVLSSDKSSYSNFNFTVNCDSRSNYVDRLKTKWWCVEKKKENIYKSNVFAGWWYGVPSWQKSLILPDDVNKDKNCKELKSIFFDNQSAVKKEINLIKKWYESGEKKYHIFKLDNSKTLVDIITSKNL